jgi:hypothetical protein
MCGELHAKRGWEGLEREVTQSTASYYIAIVALQDRTWQVQRSALWRSGRVRVLTLIRTDVMRWSLSLCSSASCSTSAASVDEFMHPQFYDHATLRSHNYSIPELRGIANSFRPSWSTQAVVALEMARASRRDFGANYSTFVYYVRAPSHPPPLVPNASPAHWVRERVDRLSVPMCTGRLLVRRRTSLRVLGLELDSYRALRC